MYQCLAQASFEDSEGYQLIPIRLEDSEKIRLWRNAQMDVLRQKHPLSEQEQQMYFQTAIVPGFKEQYPRQILFSYLYQQTLIGYGGLVYIDWESKRAEVSFLLDSVRAKQEPQYKQDFIHYLALLDRVAFGHLHFHRLFTETFAFRQEHMRILEQAGYQLEGILREHIYKKEHWHDAFFHGKLAREYQHAS